MSAYAILIVLWSAQGEEINRHGRWWLVESSTCVETIGAKVQWSIEQGHHVTIATCRSVTLEAMR